MLTLEIAHYARLSLGLLTSPRACSQESVIYVACTSPSEGGRGRHDSRSSDDSELSISDSEEDSGGVSSRAGSPDSDMAVVMQQMDRELAQTEVGRSFERVKVRSE